jgi:hypothetical protein
MRDRLAAIAKTWGQEWAEWTRRQYEAQAPAVAAFDPVEDLFLTCDGLVRVWPVNLPVVTIWRLIRDQWIRAGLEGQPVAFDMAQALAYAQAWCADHGGAVLPLVERLRFMADVTLGFITAEIQEGRRG